MHVVECPDCETRYDVHYSPTCPKCGARFGHYIEEPVTQSESFSNEIPLATGDTIEVKDGAVLEIIPATPADEVPVESDELEDFCNGVEGFNPLVIAEVILLFMQNCKLPDSELVDRARKPRFDDYVRLRLRLRQLGVKEHRKAADAILGRSRNHKRLSSLVSRLRQM